MYRQRIILFFTMTILPLILLAIATLVFCIKYSLYIPAEYWIPEAITIKEHYAKTIKGPKIIIASGSNSLFGICTPLLKEKTNKEIVNLGLHGALPAEVLFILIKKYAKQNDIVIMPLEYSYYIGKKVFKKWQIDNLTTWGTEFIKEFSAGQILELYLKAIPSIPERIQNVNVKLPIRTYKEYMQDKNPPAILLPVLDFKNIVNYFGDSLQDNQSQLKNDFASDYEFNPINLNDYRFQQFKEYAEILAKQQITLLLTYPVTIQNPAFDLSNKEHLAKIEALNTKIQEHGLHIIGIPELSNFEFAYSHTRYHLNAEGAILRSLYFADMINCYLAGIPQEIPDLEAYKNEKKAEAKKYLNEYRKLGYFYEEKK